MKYRTAIITLLIILFIIPPVVADKVLFSETFTILYATSGREFTPSKEGVSVRIEMEVITGQLLAVVISDNMFGEWTAKEWSGEDIIFRQYNVAKFNTTIIVESDLLHTLWIYGANYREPEVRLVITELSAVSAPSITLGSQPLVSFLCLMILPLIKKHKN